MKHIDLFSGIGGFALAVDTVWPNSKHIFCEIDPFCQQIINKHWPSAYIHDDIRTLTNTTNSRIEEMRERENEVFLLTGGFPCQPFSQAGRRKGTDDNRYLWSEMFRVIREFKPTWVIAENVYGLVTWSEGLVLEQVCTDLETEDYEVQPLIIPAVAVNAPHRRDRVWIVAHKLNKGLEGNRKRREASQGRDRLLSGTGSQERPSWEENWIEVATELCRVDDGLPPRMDGITRARERKERLKMLGNAIVPQVAIEIMKAIKKG